MEQSTKFTLSKYDWYSWFVNCVIFMSPVIIYLATQMAELKPIDWRFAYLTGAGLLLNLLKKWIADHMK